MSSSRTCWTSLRATRWRRRKRSSRRTSYLPRTGHVWRLVPSSGGSEWRKQSAVVRTCSLLMRWISQTVSADSEQRRKSQTVFAFFRQVAGSLQPVPDDQRAVDGAGRGAPGCRVGLGTQLHESLKIECFLHNPTPIPFHSVELRTGIPVLHIGGQQTDGMVIWPGECQV